MQVDDDRLDSLRRAYREASARVDEVPSASVRAAVLAAAARGVDAGPRPTTARNPFRFRRWPLSVAALLVVSLMTGLVATHVMRDSPERITTVASSTPAIPSAPRVVVAPDGPAAAQPSLEQPVARPADRRSSAAPPPTARKPVPAQPAHVAAAPPPAAPPIERQAKAENDATGTIEPQPDHAARQASVQALATNTRARMAATVEPPTPEAWVERIMQLRREGQDAEADREVRALRSRYPDFSIPATALRPADAQ